MVLRDGVEELNWHSEGVMDRVGGVNSNGVANGRGQKEVSKLDKALKPIPP